MVQEEFKQFKKIKESNSLYEEYELEDGSKFYIEPNFYSQLKFLENTYVDDFPNVMAELINNVKRNKKVIFTADFENPVVHEEGFIYQEIEDITDKIKLFSGYISRGSDYGD
jgi:hypothetical protein